MHSILFAHFGETFEEMGIGPVNRGQGTLKHAKQLVDLYRLPGARVHVVLDWADCPTETTETLAASMGLLPNAMTLWTKEDGKTPGVFEDVFGVDVICDAFNQLLSACGKQPIDAATLRATLQSPGKTSDALRKLFHHATGRGLDKPELALVAAQLCIERGFEPPQVTALREHLKSVLGI